jgi:tetratricopeptide (TPR) repeat protein
MLGLWDKAEEILLLGQSVWPNDDALRFNRAINVFAQGRMNDAIVELERCIRQSPYRPEYWRALGDALNEGGAKGRAFTAYARAMTLEENPETSRLVAQRMWRMLFEGAPRRGARPKGSAAAKESDGFSLIQFIRSDPEFRGKSDAAFFSYALDTVLALVDKLHSEGNKELFWGPFVLAYFEDMRRAGHMEALAMDIRRAAEDPEAVHWWSNNSAKLARYRDWSERWAVDWGSANDR